MPVQVIERALSYGDRIAVRDFESGSVTTYAELVRAARTIAAVLWNATDSKMSARVAFLMPPDSSYIITQWCIWLAGGIAVPLSRSATINELEYALVDSESTVVITDTTSSHSKLNDICTSRNIQMFLFEEVLKSESAHETTLPEIAPNHPAMILYTSGTTASPKGVLSTHGNIEAQITTLVKAWHWESNDRIPLFLPLHHIHGIVNVMLCALYSGALIEAFSKFDAEIILNRVSSNAFTIFMAVPTIYSKMIDYLQASPDKTAICRGFAGMRLMVSGSAALPASVHVQWTKLTSQKLLERYGMTEIGMAISNPYLGERRPGAVGQPLPGVEVRLQAENGTIVTREKCAGEIQVRGANVFVKYWNKPDATRESFVDGWFKTGDIGILEDGYYRIMGRNSVDIIKSGGYKLSALEIEAVLLDHPAISQCAVVGLEDDTWGEIVGAAVVLSPGNKGLDLDSLKIWSKDRMSQYKLPRKMIAVTTLPRNAMGKVQKPGVKRLLVS